MTIDSIIEDSFLSRICKAIREILSENTLIQNLLTDTKRPTEPIIGNSPLNWKAINRDYSCSVYHTCREKYNNQSNGLSNIQGIVYIDVSRKIVSKSNEIVTDELDKLSWTILEILHSHADNLDLKQTVDSWEFFDKQLWRSNPSKSEEVQNEKLIDYICMISLICNYSARYYQYEND
jgi:hypothetical protein